MSSKNTALAAAALTAPLAAAAAASSSSSFWLCEWCGKFGKERCGGCKLFWYCSPACQKVRLSVDYLTSCQFKNSKFPSVPSISSPFTARLEGSPSSHLRRTQIRGHIQCFVRELVASVASGMAGDLFGPQGMWWRFASPQRSDDCSGG